ncbi:MerC domain-containing protein [Sphingomonas sp. CJ20]
MRYDGWRDARWEQRLDGFALCASTLCMLHCLALPLVLAALPALATRLEVGESFHAIVLAFAVPTSALALIGGWRRHRAAAPMLVGAVGLTLMASGIAFATREALETGLTVAGSLFVAGAHIGNWRQRRAHCRVDGQRAATAPSA